MDQIIGWLLVHALGLGDFLSGRAKAIVGLGILAVAFYCLETGSPVFVQAVMAAGAPEVDAITHAFEGIIRHLQERTPAR